VGTRAKLLRIDVGTGEVNTLADILNNSADFSVSADGRILAFMAEKADSPREVWSLTAGQPTRQLTNFNPQITSLRLGNVREVRNVVQRCVVLAEPEGLVDRRLLPPEIAGAAVGIPEGAPPGRLETVLVAIERRMIKDALVAAGGNKSRAAAALGISREGLRLKLAKYGLG
jgi:hypothetical protein